MADQDSFSKAIPIRVVVVDSNGVPIAGGIASAVTIANGGDFVEGSVSDVAWSSGDGTVIALLKKIASAGGSAVTIADGADTVEGALADAAVTTDANGTVSGKLRGIVKLLGGTLTVTATLSAETTKVIGTVNIAAGQTVAVTGTVTANAGTNLNTSALALDSTVAKDATIISSNTKLDTLHADLGLQAKLTDTQPVSVASLPLPSGGATEATLEDIDVDVEAVNTTLLQLVQNAAPQPWFVFGQGTFFAIGN